MWFEGSWLLPVVFAGSATCIACGLLIALRRNPRFEFLHREEVFAPASPTLSYAAPIGADTQPANWLLVCAWIGALYPAILFLLGSFELLRRKWFSGAWPGPVVGEQIAEGMVDGLPLPCAVIALAMLGGSLFDAARRRRSSVSLGLAYITFGVFTLAHTALLLWSPLPDWVID